MKRINLIGMIVLLAALMLATTQALAGPAATGGPKGTPGPHDTPQTPSGGGAGPLLAGTPGAAATANAGLHGKPTIYRGTISGLDASSVTLTLADGSTVTIGLTPDTKIKVPGPQGAGDTLTMGMQAIVMALTDPNTNGLVARMVIAIPGQPVRAHRVGKVTAYTAGSSITILATDGQSYTFALTADTKILPQDQASSLAVGSLVTVIAPRVPASLVLTATGIVVHPAQ